ncbi:MAG: response regulator transcription factor [Clostridiales bacterium]|nr:response regulator transcription factor [Clostridiales bacterium]
MKIAIVQDDKEKTDELKGYISRYCLEHGKRAHVVEFSDGIDIVSDYAADYDIIFLDIAMKHMDGFNAAKHIRDMDGKVVIAFVTNDASYAVRGYSVGATSYMVKPVSYDLFSEEFARCIERAESGQTKYLLLSTDNGMDRLELDKIVYIESQSHNIIINTTEKTYNARETMRSLEDKLPREQFMRCNHCYIVNLLHVKGVHGEYALLDGGDLKISRSRRKDFLESLTKYIYM